MDNYLISGQEEFEERNYEGALNHLEKIKPKDELYDLSLGYRIPSLMSLGRYKEALKYLDYLIDKKPKVFNLWIAKAKCHIFLHEDSEVEEALKNIESVVDENNKKELVDVARIYTLLLKDEKTLEYCDKALAIDENYRDALAEKSIAAAGLKNNDMIAEIADALFEKSNKNLIESMSPFMLKLFSKDYKGALDIVNNVVPVEEWEDEYLLSLKAGIYQKLTDDLNAQIFLTKEIELDIEDAIDIMIDFRDNCKSHGVINNVEYFVA